MYQEYVSSIKQASSIKHQASSKQAGSGQWKVGSGLSEWSNIPFLRASVRATTHTPGEGKGGTWRFDIFKRKTITL